MKRAAFNEILYLCDENHNIVEKAFLRKLWPFSAKNVECLVFTSSKVQAAYNLRQCGWHTAMQNASSLSHLQ